MSPFVATITSSEPALRKQAAKAEPVAAPAEEPTPEPSVPELEALAEPAARTDEALEAVAEEPGAV